MCSLRTTNMIQELSSGHHMALSKLRLPCRKVRCGTWYPMARSTQNFTLFSIEACCDCCTAQSVGRNSLVLVYPLKRAPAQFLCHNSWNEPINQEQIVCQETWVGYGLGHLESSRCCPLLRTHRLPYLLMNEQALTSNFIDQSHQALNVEPFQVP